MIERKKENTSWFVYGMSMPAYSSQLLVWTVYKAMFQIRNDLCLKHTHTHTHNTHTHKKCASASREVPYGVARPAARQFGGGRMEVRRPVIRERHPGQKCWIGWASRGHGGQGGPGDTAQGMNRHKPPHPLPPPRRLAAAHSSSAERKRLRRQVAIQHHTHPPPHPPPSFRQTGAGMNGGGRMKEEGGGGGGEGGRRGGGGGGGREGGRGRGGGGGGGGGQYSQDTVRLVKGATQRRPSFTG